VLVIPSMYVQKIPGPPPFPSALMVMLPTRIGRSGHLKDPPAKLTATRPFYAMHTLASGNVVGRLALLDLIPWELPPGKAND
jgi:hypothetical protein